MNNKKATPRALGAVATAASRVRLRRPSPAMIVALVALFVALSGGAYAAVKLPADSVGTKQIQNRAVTANKVRKHSLLASNFKAGQLPRGTKGATGAPGLKGDTGPQGPKGDTGPPGPTASSYAHSTGGTTITSGSGTVAIDLLSVPNTASGELHRGAISVTYNARLIATGTLALRNANATSEQAYCRLVLNPQSSGGTPFYYWGVSTTMAPNTFSNPLSVTDGVDVGPGTYNVGIVCYAYGAPNISVGAADLTVIATAR